MLTAKENFLETLKKDGRPDRLVNQYQPFVPIMNDPLQRYTRGNRVRGTTSIDKWGTEILFPEDAPGPMPHVTNENKVCPDITRWKEYVKVQDAISAVRGKGYGVVTPDKEEIKLEEPVVIKQGSKYGVKIKSVSPSIHMIRANIETEIAPIVGSEEQAKDLIEYIKTCDERKESVWQTNIFGKSIGQLVEDGIHTKLVQIGDESQIKLQDTMQKIVNDSKGGLVCIII